MSSELRSLFTFASQVLSKPMYHNLQRLRREPDFEHALVYSLACWIEDEHHRLLQELRALEEQKQDVFIAHIQLMHVLPKLSYFKVSPRYQDIVRIHQVLLNVKTELSHVQSI